MIDAVIRIGKEKYMEDLFYKGEILLRRLSYYRNHENKEVGDENEGISYLYQAHEVKSMKVNEAEVDIVNQVRIKLNDSPNPFIYCMYGIYSNDQIIDIDDKCKEFGDTAIIITDIGKFRDRIYNVTKSLKSNKVKYVPYTKYNGEMNYFTKIDNYKHQKEFRLCIESQIEKDEMLITIGSIEDIAIIEKIDNLKIER